MTTFYTGRTGIGTGPHLDFRVYDVGSQSYVDPTGFTDILQVGGKPLASQYRMTSGYGPRVAPTPGASTFHRGLDFATPEGTPVTVAGGRYLTTFSDPSSGVTSQYAFTRGGKQYEAILLHGSGQNKVLGTGALTDYAAVPSTPSTSDGSPEVLNTGLNAVDLVKNQLLSSLLAGAMSGSTPSSALPTFKAPPLPSSEEEDEVGSSYLDLTSDQIRQLALQAQQAFGL